MEGVANNLRKQAAKNAIKKSNSRMGRRMLGEDADLPAADLPFQAIQSARRGLLQSAVLPSPEDALAHSSLQQDTVLDGVALPDGSISTMDAGQCAASCYFRMDCISWTVNPSGQGAGCTLLGAGATASSSPGWTSGTINVDSQWQPPPYPVPPTPLESGAGKYANVLAQTRLFVEAQRSGQIQPGDPVSWRGNSNLQDPVVGGWYNGASTLKESFPIGTSVAFLAWGLLSFPDAYQAAGVYNDYVQTVRTGADYLANCWNDGNKSFVGQIGDTKTEVEYWGRPEDETGPRPAYIWTSDMHASDLLSSAVAALASTAQLINSSDSATASQYLATAQSIYAQATSNEGLYSDYFQDATAGTFPSSAFLDDQTWAAAWMYRATQDVKYLADADSFWQRSFGANRYNADVWAGWDSLWGPAAVLMRQNWRTGVKAMDVDQYTEFIATMFVPAWTKADGERTMRACCFKPPACMRCAAKIELTFSVRPLLVESYSPASAFDTSTLIL